MADAKPSFSWSFSAAQTFQACPRKRYWGNYAAWGGWKSDAPPVARTAYRLKCMDSRHTLAGRVTEDTVRWMLDEARAGRTPTADAAYETVARPKLNEAWKQSRSDAWRKDPKRHICLHEQYYPDLHADLDPQWPEQIRANILLCLTHFLDTALPRLQDITPAEEVPIDRGESFTWNGLTIYAIPDYVYQRDGTWHIHDWKAGKPHAEHRFQLGVYALWAHVKHQIPLDQIQLYIEYLRENRVAAEPATAALIEEVQAWITETATDMTNYLHDGDPARNQPCDQIEWDMTPERSLCARCNFYELCKPELAELDAG
jgi:hypothetical protein